MAGVPDSPECVYAKKKSARWLFNLLESGLQPDPSFFAFWEWSTGCSGEILTRLKDALAKMQDSSEAEAYDDLQAIMKKWTRSHGFFDDLAELMEKYPFVEKMMTDLAKLKCIERGKISRGESAAFAQARKSLERTFGLSPTQINLCEFVFIMQSFNHVEDYFNDMRIFEFSNQGLLSKILKTEPLALRKCLAELISCGILEKNHSIELSEELLSLWDVSGGKNAGELFCRPIGRKFLPLEDFNIAPEELAHVKSLLFSEDGAPLHILLYGPPGTGKTTFAASLANALKLRAWSVACNENSFNNERRPALKASLNMASKHKGAFVLFDEADSFLDIGYNFARSTKPVPKAWLNSFLEEPGRRVVWVVNDIEQIDASVRRRFTFSIRFGELNGMERKKVWSGVLSDHRAKKSIPEPEIERLARDYKVPTAVVESAIRQAKMLSCAGRNFTETAELVLRSYLTLSQGRGSPCALDKEKEEYITAGVSLEGSIDELLDRLNIPLREGHLSPK